MVATRGGRGGVLLTCLPEMDETRGCEILKGSNSMRFGCTTQADVLIERTDWIYEGNILAKSLQKC